MATISSNLFIPTPRKINLPFGLSNFVATTNYLKPKGSGTIDVLTKYRWKNSSRNVQEVPSITLTEFELSLGTWAANLSRLLQAYNDFKGNGYALDPYMPLYNVNNRNTGTGFVYRLPYLLGDGSKIRNVENNWGEFQGGLDKLFGGGDGGGVVSGITTLLGYAFAGTSPGVGFEEISEFKNTNLESITITFPLYNTVTVQDAQNNYDFLTLFTYQNLKTRTSFLTFIPPKIYTVQTENCLGGIYWPVAIVSNLLIESIGTTREISDYNGKTLLMPEAFKVSITLKQLVPNSSNIFEGAIGGEKVNVLSDTESLESTIGNITQSVANFGSSITREITNP